MRVPPAISWLPHAVQGILASKVSLGQAIIEAARQTGNDASRFGDAHLVQLANLNEAVRQRSSSPRVDIFAEAARPQRRSPVSRPKPIIEPPVPAQHFSISSGPMSEDEVVPAPAGFLVGAQDDANAKDAGEVRVPSTGTLDSRSTSSVVLRRRAEVARRRAAAAPLQQRQLHWLNRRPLNWPPRRLSLLPTRQAQGVARPASARVALEIARRLPPPGRSPFSP